MRLLANGVELKATYQEPIANADGTSLNDLHHTSVYYDLGVGPVNVVDLPASLNTGGGTKDYTFIVPVLDGEIKDVAITATATDNAPVPNTSVHSMPFVMHIDRSDKVAPEPPGFLSAS